MKSTTVSKLESINRIPADGVYGQGWLVTSQ